MKKRVLSALLIFFLAFQTITVSALADTVQEAAADEEAVIASGEAAELEDIFESEEISEEVETPEPEEISEIEEELEIEEAEEVETPADEETSETEEAEEAPEAEVTEAAEVTEESEVTEAAELSEEEEVDLLTAGSSELDFHQPASDFSCANLVVFVNFADTVHSHSLTLGHCFSTEGDAEYTNYLFNGTDENGSVTNARAMKQYLSRVSGGQFQLQNVFPQLNKETNTIEPYSLSQNASYYAKNKDVLVTDVIAALNAQAGLNGIQLDKRNRGLLDNLMIVVPCESGDYNSEFYGLHITYAGTDKLKSTYNVSHVTIVTEGAVYCGIQESGLLIHEFMHTIGYPDLYVNTSSTDENAPKPVYTWDIMSSDSKYVQYPLAYMRQCVSGWLELPVITESTAGYELFAETEQLHDRQAVILKTDKSDSEFFVVEYRRKNNSYNENTYDSKIPGSGLIIYRVNTERHTNMEGIPYFVYVFRPNDSFAGGGEAAVGEFYNSYLAADQNRTSFGQAETNKGLADNAITYSSGVNSGIVIKNVGTAGGESITFDIEFNETVTVWETLTSGRSSENTSENTALETAYPGSNGLMYFVQEDYDTHKAALCCFDPVQKTWTVLANAPSDNAYGMGYKLCEYQGELYLSYVNTSYKFCISKYDKSGRKWTSVYTSSMSYVSDFDAAANDSGIRAVIYDGENIKLITYSLTEKGKEIAAPSSMANCSNPRLAIKNGTVYAAARQWMNNDQVVIVSYENGAFSDMNVPSMKGSPSLAIAGQKLFVLTEGSEGKSFCIDLSGETQAASAVYDSRNVINSKILNWKGAILIAYTAQENVNGQSVYETNLKQYKDGAWTAYAEPAAYLDLQSLELMGDASNIYISFVSAGSRSTYVKRLTQEVEIPDTPEEPEEPEIDPTDPEEPTDCTDGIWVYGLTEQIYTGQKIIPDFIVYDGDKKLEGKKDYKYSLKNNTNAGTAVLTINGVGNYKGKIVKSFEILSRSIEEEEFNAPAIQTAFTTGKNYKPAAVLYRNGKKLSSGKDFTVSWVNELGETNKPFRSPGTYLVTIRGCGNYQGERTAVFELASAQKLITKAVISKIAKQEYTGEEIHPAITVTLEKKTLTEGNDFQINWQSCVDPGTAKFEIVGIGDYKGTKTGSFEISGKPLSKVQITGFKDEMIYAFGTELLQDEAVLMDGSKQLVKDVDYSVTYGNARNSGKTTGTGKVSVVFKGKGLYTGSINKTYKIIPYDISADSAAAITISYNRTAVYTPGGAIPSDITVTADGAELVLHKDYEAVCSNNKRAADETAAKAPILVIKGKGNYAGSRTAGSYTIEPCDIEMDQIEITAPDKTVSKKSGTCFSVPVLKHTEASKKLTAGTDYEKTVVYTYLDGTPVGKTDVIPKDTVIRATVKGINNYKGTKSVCYRIVGIDINKVAVKIPVQYYTGSQITPDKSKLEVTYNKKPLSGESFVIEGYGRNVETGYGTVTIRGEGDFGGRKTVKFKIAKRTFAERIANFLRNYL